jgi:hypothetical protein
MVAFTTEFAPPRKTATAKKRTMGQVQLLSYRYDGPELGHLEYWRWSRIAHGICVPRDDCRGPARLNSDKTASPGPAERV